MGRLAARQQPGRLFDFPSFSYSGLRACRPLRFQSARALKPEGRPLAVAVRSGPGSARL